MNNREYVHQIPGPYYEVTVYIPEKLDEPLKKEFGEQARQVHQYGNTGKAAVLLDLQEQLTGYQDPMHFCREDPNQEVTVEISANQIQVFSAILGEIAKDAMYGGDVELATEAFDVWAAMATQVAEEAKERGYDVEEDLSRVFYGVLEDEDG
jgi:hypothetical protein